MDSACTGGGTSDLGKVGGELLQPSGLQRRPDGAKVDGLRLSADDWAFWYWAGDGGGQGDGVVEATGGGRERDGLGRRVGRAGNERGVSARGRAQLGQADAGDYGTAQTNP